LRISGEIAEAEGSEKVESKHFDHALDRVEADYLENLLERLPANQIIFLFILAKYKEHEDQDIMNTGLIYKGLQEIVGRDKVLSYRRISGILKELEVIGLIGGWTTSKSGGGYGREIWLKVPADKVLDYTERKWKKQKTSS
jgi:cell division control protein 6